jgi:hypothetical protein
MFHNRHRNKKEDAMMIPYPSEEHRNRLIIIAEVHRVLIRWAPKLVRAHENIHSAKFHLNEHESSHPEWLVPDRRKSVGYYFIILGLFAAAVIDTLLISAVAEYVAETLFPHSPLIILLTRLLVPTILIIFEVMLAYLIISARERTTWDGSRSEFRFYSRLGWVLIGVTPLLLFASLFADEKKLSLHLMLMAVGLGLLGMVIHATVIKSGYWFRESFAYHSFNQKRRNLKRKMKRHQRHFENAADRIRIAYPVYKSAHLEIGKSTASDLAGQYALPIDVMKAIAALFKLKKSESLELPDMQKPPLLGNPEKNDTTREDAFDPFKDIDDIDDLGDEGASVPV